MPRPITKRAAGVVQELRTIQSTTKISKVPEVNFDWSPKLIAYTLQVGGNIYPWRANEPVQGALAQGDIYRTAAAQEITFVADVRVPTGILITEYEWSFGDGGKGYGDTVTHSYTTSAPSARTRLCVTDNRGRRFCVGRPMNLYLADLAVIGGFSLVNPPRDGDLVAGSPTVSNIDTVGLVAGMGVKGDGVPDGTTILSIVNATSLTLSANATDTLTSSLWFTA